MLVTSKSVRPISQLLHCDDRCVYIVYIYIYIFGFAVVRFSFDIFTLAHFESCDLCASVDKHSLISIRLNVAEKSFVPIKTAGTIDAGCCSVAWETRIAIG